MLKFFRLADDNEESAGKAVCAYHYKNTSLTPYRADREEFSTLLVITVRIDGDLNLL